MRRASLLWLAGALLLAGCADTRTSVLLTIRGGPNLPQPGWVELSVLTETGVAVERKRLPDEGELSGLPNTVVLYPAQESGKLRVLARGMEGTQILGEGTVVVTLEPGSQVEATVTVDAGLLPDRDKDGIPDEIDNCPDLPNPDQGSCGPDAGDAGPADGDGPFVPDGVPDGLPDGTVDQGKPDIDCDKDDDTYISVTCGGNDCDDNDPEVHPGQKEGMAGSAECSDGVDNDCDGSQDQQDSDCNECTADADCDDGDECSQDQCVGGLCTHTAINEGAPCANPCVAGGKCQSGVCTGKPKTCPTPTNFCKEAYCDPGIGCTEVNKADGTACQDSDPCTTNETCLAGTCTAPPQWPACYIGGTCYPDGTKPDSCHICDTSASSTSWTLLSGYCYIDGACEASGTNTDACHTCDPSTSTSSWTLLSNYCYIDGACEASGTNSDVCHTCDPSASTSSWTLVSGYCYIWGVCRTDGTKQGTCRVCDVSNSTSSWTILSSWCYISGSCHQSGATGSGCQVCDPADSQTSWSIQPDCGIVLVALNQGHNGNLGGLSGANTLCQNQANAAGFNSSYKAFLSTSTQNVSGLITGTAATGIPVYNATGEQLYSSWSSIFSSASWAGGLYLYAFDGKRVDEGQGAVPEWNDADGWTGSLPNGTVSTGNTCADWTSSLSTSTGASGELDLNHMMTPTELNACNLNQAVICVRIPN